MYLQKLEIQGFKSFATKTSLVFNRGIAAIVGPNGSGKSNIADAIRWALGEQSMRTLRGKRSDDVIFSGSDKKSRQGMAEVSMTINNEDGKMPVDFPEVLITRRVYRNGEGEYFLNRQPVRLHDIVMLLARSNFGQKAYSVIAQGMIDHILVASPQERKEFFDEAAGVRQYQIKREQALNKLAATKDNLAQAELLMQEVEPRLRSLTRQVRRLERRQEIEQELRSHQEAYFSQIWGDLSAQYAEQKKMFQVLESEQRAASLALEKVQSEIEAIAREKRQDEAFHDLERNYGQTLEEKNALLKEQVLLRGRRDLSATQQGQLNAVWLNNRLSDIDRRLKPLAEEIASLRQASGQGDATLREKKKSLADILTQFRELEQALQAASASMKERTSVNLPALHQRLTEIAAAHDRLVESLSAATDLTGLAKLKTEARSIGQSVRRLLDSVAQGAGQHDPATVLRLQQRLTEFLKTKDGLVEEIHILEKAVAQQAERLISLEREQERLAEERVRLAREIERSQSPDDAAARRHLFLAEEKDVQTKIDELEKKLRAITASLQKFNVHAQDKRDRLFALQKTFRDRQHSLNSENEKLNAIQVALAKLETRKDDIERELRAELPSDSAQHILSRTTPKTDSERKPESYYQEEIARCKRSLELVGGIDEGITAEYNTTSERYDFLKHQTGDLHSALKQLEQVIAELDRTIKEQFDAAFERINHEFQHYFRLLFRGGQAKLILRKEVIVDPAEIEAENEEQEEEEEEIDASADKKATREHVVVGIDITATPPGKKLTTIAMLSGGERALTAIALISAIIANNPSPFVVLDEVDAALDEANSQRFSAILGELATKTQFVLITHNRATMEKASLLYGVTMGDDGVSKLISVKMEEAEAVINRHGNR